MERNRLILPGIIIVAAVIITIIAALSFGNNIFTGGKLYFEYPKSWGQNHVV